MLRVLKPPAPETVTRAPMASRFEREPTSFTFKDGFAVDETFTANPDMPESIQVFDFADVEGATRATFVATYADAESLQKVLDMGAVEGSTLAINQIDDLLAS